MALSMFPSCWRPEKKIWNKETELMGIKKLQPSLCCLCCVSPPLSYSVEVPCLPGLSVVICWVVKVPVAVVGTNTIPADKLLVVWFLKKGFTFGLLKEAVYLRGGVKGTRGCFILTLLFRNKENIQDATWSYSPIQMFRCARKSQDLGPSSLSCTIVNGGVAG